MDETPPSAMPHTGGSAAGQALRAELAKQGIDPEAEFAAATAAAQAHTPSPATPPTEARTAVRKKVTGRARLVLHGSSVTLSGKMMDISTTGACVLMEDMLPPKKLCQISCDIFHEGKRYAFSVQAITVYSVLASGKGFKIGLHLGPHDITTKQTLAALVSA